MSKSLRTPSPEPIRRNLLAWWDVGHRDLPWRRTKDPYAIWIAEIMLQQTQVKTATPYYERFLKRLPTVEALARARLDTVYKLWEGLGYYTRAANLHRTAQLVVSEYDGRFPSTVEELMKLPGIGRYTAGAIASIAFGTPAPIVDGNIVRILCRVYLIREDPKTTAVQKRIWQLAETLVCTKRPGELNQSLMELGARVCRPLNPDCPNCPIRRSCLARKEGVQNELPLRGSAKRLPHYTIAAGVVYKDGKILIAKRKAEGLLGGLWEFPGGKKEKGETLKAAVAREVKEETGVDVRVGKRLAVVKHTYSHFKITMHVFACDYAGGTARAIDVEQVCWVLPDRLDRYAFPAANRRVLRLLQNP